MTEEEKAAAELQKRVDETLEKVEDILRHHENVRENCLIISRALIEEGKIELGKRLIVNSMSHDSSKFFGIEWEYLGADTAVAKLDMAVAEHGSKNSHHPEFHSGIDEMPLVAIAEMVADWKARSEEFGSSIHEWVNVGAMQRFGYKKNSRVHKEILYFLGMLCDKPFKQRKPSISII